MQVAPDLVGWKKKEKEKKRNNVTLGRVEKQNNNKQKRSVIESRLSYLCQDVQLMLGGLPLHKHTALCSHLRKHVLPASSRLLEGRRGRGVVHTRYCAGTQKGRLLLSHPATRGCRQCAHIVPVLAWAQDSFRERNKNKRPDGGSKEKLKPEGGAKKATMSHDGIRTYIFLCRDMTAHVSAWKRVD